MHCGHKGLFLDRLDAGVAAGTAEIPRLVPYAHLVVQVRNRAYSPALGRFFQQDPNATAMALIGASVYHGRGVGALVTAFGLEELYGDGANLYAYLGSNPWQRHDALGLSWDPFDAVDEYLSQETGATAALMQKLGQSAVAVLKVSATIASYLPFPGISILGDLALYALGEKSGPELATGVAMGLLPMGRIAAFLGKHTGVARLLGVVSGIGRSLIDTSIQYAGKFGNFALGAAKWVACRVLQIACFEEGTLVWTADGHAPIECVVVGDVVLALDEQSGEYVFSEVTATIVHERAPILGIGIVRCDGLQDQVRCTEEHPFRLAGGRWRAARGLNPGDIIDTAEGPACVQEVGYTGRLATVYNLEVADAHTFVVGPAGSVVHNGCFSPEWRHIIPREFWESHFLKSAWNWTRLELDNFGITLLQDMHKRIHGKGVGLSGAWNDRWRQFIGPYDIKGTAPSKNAVFAFANKLMKEFGLDQAK
jgi:hypothetical protein